MVMVVVVETEVATMVVVAENIVANATKRGVV